MLDAQKGEFILKASEEQIRAVDKKDEEGGRGIWPLPFGGGESENKINILRQNPVESNEFGELREVKPSDFRPLEEFDVTVSFANITQVCSFHSHWICRLLLMYYLCGLD